MTLQSLIGGVQLPRRPNTVAGAGLTIGNHNMATASEKLAYVFRAWRTCDINRISLLVNTVTGSGDLIASIQGVTVTSTPGFPDGSALASKTLAVSTTGWKDFDLTTNASLTRRSLYAVVVACPAASPPNIDLGVIGSSLTWGNDFPYMVFDSAGTGTWTGSEFGFIGALKATDEGIENLDHFYPFNAVAQQAFNSSSTPDERGIIGSFPFKCSIGGASVWWSPANAADIKLYRGTTLLSTTGPDPDEKRAVGMVRNWIPFDADYDFDANEQWRITVVPTSTSNVTLNEFTVASAVLLGGCDGGPDIHFTQRTDGGSFTETTTRRACIYPIVRKLDDGAGGGGGMLIHPGTLGGLRG